MDVQANSEKTEDPSQPPKIEKFKPGWKLLCALASVAIVNLACALDATVVSVALPVSLLFIMCGVSSALIY